MTGLVAGASLVCAGLGVGCGLLVLARTREPAEGLRVLVDLLLASALLRLSADATSRELATVGLVAGVRALVGSHGLRPGRVPPVSPRTG